MKCPYCDTQDNFLTVESRSRPWGVKRRKLCLSCNRTFPTIEINQITDEALASLRRSKITIKARAKTKERIKENEKK